jgi:polysaccharide biosynthesis transport protein
VVAGILAGLVVATVTSLTTVRTYVSSVELFVSASQAPDAPSAYQGGLFSQQRVASYARILTGSQLAQTVVDDLKLPLTAREVASKVTATPLPETVVLDVQVTDTSPERAQRIADSLARHFTSQVADLEKPESSGAAPVRVTTIQAANFNPNPVAPDIRSDLLRGAAVGLLVGLGMALLRDRLDRSVRTNDDVLAATGMPPIARVLVEPRAKRHVTAAVSGPSRIAQACQTLQLAVQAARNSRTGQVVVVNSALPGEGKSVVSIGLALALARAGRRVVLVDANLLRPRVTRYLGLEEDQLGLTNILAGGAQIADVTQAWGSADFTVIPAGPLPGNSADLLASDRMRTLLDALRDAYDFVVVDAAALLAVDDAAAVTLLADSCILVSRYGRTTRDQLAESADAVARANCRLLGVVLNQVPTSAAPGDRGRYDPDDDRMRTRMPTAASAPSVGPGKRKGARVTAITPAARAPGE